MELAVVKVKSVFGEFVAVGGFVPVPKAEKAVAEYAASGRQAFLEKVKVPN